MSNGLRQVEIHFGIPKQYSFQELKYEVSVRALLSVRNRYFLSKFDQNLVLHQATRNAKTRQVLAHKTHPRPNLSLKIWIFNKLELVKT